MPIDPILNGEAKLLISKLFIGLVCLLFSFNSHAQTPILEDKSAVDSLKKATEHIYNYRFDQSDVIINRLKVKYGNHPGIVLLSCISQFWRNFPIGAKPKEFAAYEKMLGQVLVLSDKMKAKYPNSPEPVFYEMMANLILARHHSEMGEYIRAVNETRKAFPLIKKGFSLKSTYADFYFSTGMYNYYREAFPENHPMYKPFTVFFTEGNKALGLKELEIASQKAIFCRAESYIFLSMIHLRDLYNIPTSLKYATQLHESFPGNWLFAMNYAECLIESRKFDNAEPIVNRLLSRNEPSALQAGFYLKGLIEKGENRPESARTNFAKSISYGGKSKDRLSKGFFGLCYNELGKLAKEDGKTEAAKKFFRLALENCAFKKVKEDAKRAGY
ncbi:MAG TPA: tetratricopeptide repeat protein [Catalimonadaceae bacterium]|nr:tetratricopeptide repeat protein [Catalimonadaceae bacterium]